MKARIQKGMRIQFRKGGKIIRGRVVSLHGCQTVVRLDSTSKLESVLSSRLKVEAVNVDAIFAAIAAVDAAGNKK